MAKRSLTIGRIVHYKLASNGKVRPAIVVQVWNKDETGGGTVNLQVFTDGINDMESNVMLVTSVQRGFGKDQWHWPDEVDKS